jgi:hypothetical protein
MNSLTSRSRFPRPSGVRVGIVIGLALGLLGAVVGTATGAVTQFQKVVITNTVAEPVPVVGTVSVSNTPSNQQVTVSNFPTTQAVSGTVDIGSMPAGPLATKRITHEFNNSGSSSISFASMNVTSVIVADGDEDNYDISIGGFPLVVDHEGNYSEEFTAAFPTTGVGFTCENVGGDLSPCDVTVTILGY